MSFIDAKFLEIELTKDPKDVFEAKVDLRKGVILSCMALGIDYKREPKTDSEWVLINECFNKHYSSFGLKWKAVYGDAV